MSQVTQEDIDLQAFMQTLTVLYVEDNAEVRTQLTQFLRRRFHNVITAENGAEGLRAFTQAEQSPDLVITDLRMPIMDGLTMTGHLKEQLDHERRDVPVMVITAHEETDFLMRAIDIGVDQFIVKPVDTRKLQSGLLKIARQLQSERMLQQVRTTLASNEERYRTLFWTAMDAFCIFDWDTLQIVEINRRHQALYGYSQEQLADQNMSILFDGRSQLAVRELVEETARIKEPMILGHQNASKETFPVEMTIGQFSANEEGRSFGLMAARDARERLENMEEQEAVVDALEITIEALEGLLTQ